jgi:hypothetical protein
LQDIIILACKKRGIYTEYELENLNNNYITNILLNRSSIRYDVAANWMTAAGYEEKSYIM